MPAFVKIEPLPDASIHADQSKRTLRVPFERANLTALLKSNSHRQGSSHPALPVQVSHACKMTGFPGRPQQLLPWQRSPSITVSLLLSCPLCPWIHSSRDPHVSRVAQTLDHCNMGEEAGSWTENVSFRTVVPKPFMAGK